MNTEEDRHLNKRLKDAYRSVLSNSDVDPADENDLSLGYRVRRLAKQRTNQRRGMYVATCLVLVAVSVGSYFRGFLKNDTPELATKPTEEKRTDDIDRTPAPMAVFVNQEVIARGEFVEIDIMNEEIAHARLYRIQKMEELSLGSEDEIGLLYTSITKEYPNTLAARVAGEKLQDFPTTRTPSP